jgi:hypothetical protein
MQNDNHAGDTATIAITNTIDRNIDSWKVCFFSHPELITPELKRTQALTMTLTESAHEVCHHVWIDSELSPPRMD